MGAPSEVVPATPGGSVGPITYADQPSRSPWIAQVGPRPTPRPLRADTSADVVIVGAGIAGIATAFFTLRDTTRSVLLLERDQVAFGGATGRNAGQLTTYFERPLASIAEEFGEDRAVEAQAAFDAAHDLLDLLVAESAATVRVERFDGHMGMRNRNHLLVHLANNAVRARGGIPTERIRVSSEAPFLPDLPPDLAGLVEVVRPDEIREVLEIDDDRYLAVLSDRKGCANSGLLVTQVLAYLETAYPDRFQYHDRSPVGRVVVGADGVRLALSDADVLIGGSHVVLCTNGFVDHVVEDAAGHPIELHPDQHVAGTIGFMTAFLEPQPRAAAAFSYIRNVSVGSGEAPYVYVTRRTYDLPDGSSPTLTAMGGPEWPIEPPWEATAPFPGSLLATMDNEVRPFAQPSRAPGQAYDFAWHGLMGYMPGRIRVIGAHPAHPSLLYNLGCNGVGFLPSLHGGRQVARLLAGDRLAPSIFDPRTP
jgi:glycine/D-amino acid oxidase-like deaminating enzyme